MAHENPDEASGQAWNDASGVGGAQPEEEESGIQAFDSALLSHPDGSIIIYITSANDDQRNDVAVFRVDKRSTAIRGVDYISHLVVSRSQPDKVLYVWNWLSQFRLAVNRMLRAGAGQLRIGSYSLLPIAPLITGRSGVSMTTT